MDIVSTENNSNSIELTVKNLFFHLHLQPGEVLINGQVSLHTINRTAILSQPVYN